MKRLRSYVDRLATAQKRYALARGRRDKGKAIAKVKSIRAELKHYRAFLREKKQKAVRLERKARSHETFFGDRKPDVKGLEKMQDYLHHRVNRPVPDWVVLKYKARLMKIEKRLKRASSLARLELMIEHKYLTTRLRQTRLASEV